MHACMHACMHVCIYVCMYVCMYVYVYICVYIKHIYIYIYIYTHKCSQPRADRAETRRPTGQARSARQPRSRRGAARPNDKHTTTITTNNNDTNDNCNNTTITTDNKHNNITNNKNTFRPPLLRREPNVGGINRGGRLITNSRCGYNICCKPSVHEHAFLCD